MALLGLVHDGPYGRPTPRPSSRSRSEGREVLSRLAGGHRGATRSAQIGLYSCHRLRRAFASKRVHRAGTCSASASCSVTPASRPRRSTSPCHRTVCGQRCSGAHRHDGDGSRRTRIDEGEINEAPPPSPWAGGGVLTTWHIAVKRPRVSHRMNEKIWPIHPDGGHKGGQLSECPSMPTRLWNRGRRGRPAAPWTPAAGWRPSRVDEAGSVTHRAHLKPCPVRRGCQRGRNALVGAPVVGGGLLRAAVPVVAAHEAPAGRDRNVPQP